MKSKKNNSVQMLIFYHFHPNPMIIFFSSFFEINQKRFLFSIGNVRKSFTTSLYVFEYLIEFSNLIRLNLDEVRTNSFDSIRFRYNRMDCLSKSTTFIILSYQLEFETVANCYTTWIRCTKYLHRCHGLWSFRWMFTCWRSSWKCSYLEIDR